MRLELTMTVAMKTQTVHNDVSRVLPLLIRSSSTPFDALRVSINPPSYSRLKVRFGGLSLVGDALATAWRFSDTAICPKGSHKAMTKLQ